MVDRLFIEWRNNFGDKLKDRKQLNTTTLNIWAVALTAMNMTNAEFEIAFINSLKEQWSPTSPADFLALARKPIADNYPNSDTAYIAAAKGNYLHPVCHETAQRIGTFEMRSQSGYITAKQWQRIYKEVCIEHSQNATKFDKNIAAIERKRQSVTHALEAPTMSLEAQSAITLTALYNIRKLL